MTSLTNSGLKPFCTEISLKNGGKRTSDYLDVRSNILWTPRGARYHATASGLDISVISTLVTDQSLVTDLNHG